MVRGIQIWSTNFGVAQNSIERFVHLRSECSVLSADSSDDPSDWACT